MMLNSPRSLSVLGLLAAPSLLLAQAVPASSPTAQPVPVVNEEAEVVISATRGDGADPHSVPNFITTQEAADFDRQLVRSLPEALLELPGVNVQKTSNGQGSPYIRGFTGFRTLALIDGVRFNNSVFRDGPNEYWNTIDYLSLDRMELVQGQGSVLYGSDAIGGTINVLTRQSNYADETAGQSFMHGSTFHRYSSAEQSYTGRLETQFGVGGEWGLHIGATLKDFGNVRAAGFGTQPFTGYEEWSYDARLDVKLSDKWELTLAHQLLDQDDVWRTHSTLYGVSFAGSAIGKDLRRSFDTDRTLSYARLSGHDLGTWVDAATLTVSYQTQNQLLDRVRSTKKRELSGHELGTWGVDLQFVSESPLGTLTYGADYYRDSVDSYRTDFNADGSIDKRRIQGPVGDAASYNLFGLFLQDEITLSQRLSLFLGGRYTYAAADVGRYEDPLTGDAASFSDDWQNFVASARLQYDLDDKEAWKLYGGVSQGFRAPNLSDVSRLDIARSNELETSATDLNPEKFINYELGVKARTDRLSGSLGYFYTDIRDMIVRRPTGRIVNDSAVVTKSNAARGFMHGVELALNYQLSDGWSIFGNATWLEGEADAYPTSSDRSVREPANKLQPLIGTAGIRWQSTGGKVWTELVCTAASRADRLSTADLADVERIPPGGTPSWTLLGIRAGWQVTEQVSLLGSLDNLLDEAYRTHGSGSNEPGFGASLAVRVSF